jgi:HemY protein
VHSLFDMQAQTGQWKAAQATLETGMRQKVVTADRGRTLRALLLVERSRACENDGNDTQALDFAREAFGLAPERIAVASQLAGLQIKTGDGRRAMKTLEKTWSLAPHPDLAALYITASGEKDPLKRVGIVRRLAAQKPDDMESQLALAQAALEAGLWGEARRYLDAAGGANPSVRVCRLMAEVEEHAQSDQAKVHDWLTRAAHAPVDKAWRCSACHAHHEAWRSVCGSCGAFGTLHWRTPGTFGQVLPPEAPKPALGMSTMNTVSGG